MSGGATPGSRFRDLPIRRKLTLLLVLSSAVSLILAGVILISHDWITKRDTTIRGLESLARISAENSTAALAFRDQATAVQTLSALRALPEIQAACLYAPDADGRPLLFARFVPAAGTQCPEVPGPTGLQESTSALSIVVSVQEAGDEIGWLLVRESLEPLQQALNIQISITLAILGAAFLISFSAGRLMQRILVDPVLDLAAVARKVSKDKDYSQRAQKLSADELGGLTDDFNQMLERIAESEGEMQRLNGSLHEQVKETRVALEQLKDAQTQLIQSEKLASLGGLVAGVAHEINTPVGVGVTAASTLADRAATLKRLYAEEKMKRSDLERFIEVSNESTLIILKNLQRAADLIQSFKQVAVDQSSGDRRRFGLKAYLEEVLVSLAPTLKKTQHHIEVDCPDDLVVDSYPGALAQIITNLVSNSLVHAFREGQAGSLRFHIRPHDDWVTLTYSDDGRGIPAENLPKIFDPFFTTKRGQGGSGLGMHIVFNLVTQVLGGAVDAGSVADEGAKFTIGFPVTAKKVTA